MRIFRLKPAETIRSARAMGESAKATVLNTVPAEPGSLMRGRETNTAQRAIQKRIKEKRRNDESGCSVTAEIKTQRQENQKPHTASDSRTMNISPCIERFRASEHTQLETQKKRIKAPRKNRKRTTSDAKTTAEKQSSDDRLRAYR